MLWELATVSLLSSFILLLAKKQRWIEWAQVRAPKLLSQLLNCEFCLSFWVNVLISITFCIFAGDINWLVPLMATPITRKLLC